MYFKAKMPQSGVGSMQGSKERTHTRGGRTRNVTQQTDTHIFKGGGRAHNLTQRTDTRIFPRGGTHPQCNPTNENTYFHKGGGRTHKVTQRTDTHIFTGGDAPTM